jgi:hypothetical protein
VEPDNADCGHSLCIVVIADDEREGPRATLTDIDTQQIRRKSVLNGLINEYPHAA